jgi:hypothetical protein
MQGHEILNVTPQGPILQSIEGTSRPKYVKNKRSTSNWYKQKLKDTETNKLYIDTHCADFINV